LTGQAAEVVRPDRHSNNCGRWRPTKYRSSLNTLACVAIGEGVALVAPMGYSVEAQAWVRIIPLVDHELAFTPIYAVIRQDGVAKSATERLLNFLISPSRRYVEQGREAPGG
jgi:DNA-binding transcriptional LysR family regulator